MVHCFAVGGRNLVLDVNSGALHCVDETAFEIIKKMQEAKSCDFSVCEKSQDFFCAAPESVRDEIRGLIDANQLFSAEKSREVHSHMQNRRPVVKALCLHIAHECNLRCAYCFAGQGSYNENDRGLMSLETGKKAIDFLIENSGTRRNLEVDFFGGEPMLNFDVVKGIVSYGRMREAEAEKNFRFTLTTNGTLLNDENIAYINENFDNVVLSIDGRPHVNDQMRPFCGGGGSYEKILPKIKKLAATQKNYFVRGTYTRHNLDFSADVMHLADAGFKNISVEPVVAPPHEDYSIRDEDLPALFAEYEKLAQEILSREKNNERIHFFHFEMDITGGPCIAKRVTGCGAGSEYLAVTPSGKLYPCHQFVGDEKFCVGDLSDNRTVSDLFDFSSCHVFAKPECAACWAKFYCSGGCIATAYHANGDIRKPDKISCELMRKRIECALYIFAERSCGGFCMKLFSVL
jgi:uncharacterized protein